MLSSVIMCSIAEYPYYDEVGGPLLSPIHGKVTCGGRHVAHQTPWVVPINDKYGLDLIGLSGEAVIITALMFVILATKKTAEGKRVKRWSNLSVVSFVLVTIYIFAIIVTTCVRLGVGRA